MNGMDKEELKQIYASIHPLRMEGDMVCLSFFSCDSIFQSTPSAWRVTSVTAQQHFRQYISIHTLRMEGDEWVQP